MYFENTNLENLTADQELIENIMKKNGLECDGAWDYERMTFDRRFDTREGTYYLRVFAYAQSGDVGAHDAVLTLMKPVLGKHYYPHGVEYGEDEVFPAHLVKKCDEILKKVRLDLEAFVVEAPSNKKALETINA
ncbi:YugN family protein [Lysinibacillus sp. NPDC097195]|uniref:YugN family protein n=1 Tax=Lysinibacillus sp. NPDC097195 TaxID=3364141 RepID=UPI00380642C6